MESARRALLVEDDQHVCELVDIVLRSEGFSLEVASNGHSGLELATRGNYDLVVLDLMLPRLDGWEVCQRLRQNPDTRSVPIIMLTAKGKEEDKVRGLELGADDYLTKPFGLREFLARVRALLRRTHDFRRPSAPLQFGAMEIDHASHRLTMHGQDVELTPKEFALVEMLAHNYGQTLNREQLLQKVWGLDYVGGERTVDEHVKRVRQKLAEADPDHTYIQTVWGVGYRFEVKEDAIQA